MMVCYRSGRDPRRWGGMLATSAGGGRAGEQPSGRPQQIAGPIKNKPIQLPGGDLLCGSSTEHDGWRVHRERTSDLGKTWTMHATSRHGK